MRNKNLSFDRKIRLIRRAADRIVEDNQTCAVLGDFPQRRESVALIGERIERVEHIDDIELACDVRRDVEHVASVKLHLGISSLSVRDRIVVAIDSRELAPSMAAQIFRAPAATASNVEHPAPRIFRNRAKRPLNRLLLTGMRVIPIANKRKNPLTLE